MIRNRIPFLVAVVGALGVLAAAPVLAGEEAVVDGVLHVKNGNQSAEGTQIIELEEAWRVGGDDGEDFFGMISQVAVGDDGTIYLLDTRLSEVPVYSPDGERLATLSREGDGPGEVRTPSGLMLMSDGTLGIVQVFPGKVVKIATDGAPAGEFRPGGGDPTQGGFLQLYDCVAAGSGVVATVESIAQAGQGQQDRTNFVASFDAEGNEQVRFWESTRHLNFAQFEFDEDKRMLIDYRRVAVSRDGRIYVATERNRYTVNVYTADGELERVIERAYENRPRDPEEIERVRSTLEAALSRLPNPKISISKTVPDIGGIVFGPDGNLWVSSSRSGWDQPEGIFYTWDVFSPGGHFIKQVAARCPGDGEQDLMIWTPQGNAVLVTGFTEALEALQGRTGNAEDDDGGDEAAPMEVIYLRPAGA